MSSRSGMAILAGASVLAPQMVHAEGLVPAPAPSPVQEGNAVTFTVDPGEDLSQRQGITVEQGNDGFTYYILNVGVTVTPGSVGYAPNGTAEAADGQSAADLLSWVSVESTPAGEWNPTWWCIGQRDMTSIPWTPQSSSVQLRLFLKKDAFDARRVQIAAPIVFTVWVEPMTSCESATDTSTDDSGK